jgi:hypothetical protein
MSFQPNVGPSGGKCIANEQLRVKDLTGSREKGDATARLLGGLTTGEIVLPAKE